MAANISDNDFQKEVLDNKGLVLIDFWAEWCGPCKMLAPIIEQLSVEMEKTVKIVKMDIDQNPENPSKLGIRSIPTLMLFKDGKQVASKVGMHPKETFKEWIESYI